MLSVTSVVFIALAGFSANAIRLQERIDHFGDPTKAGHMLDMSRHQEWVTRLLNNSVEGQEAAAQHVPGEFTIIKAARASPASRGAALAACSAVLANKDHAMKPYLAAAGAIDMITGALRHFSDDKDVLKLCSQALCSGLLLYEYDLMEYAGQLGGVELVLNAQRNFKEDPSMQFGGVSGCFHDFSYANRLRFQKAGGIEYLIETIERHFDKPEVVLQCWYAFSSGTQTPNELPFVEAGGIPWALKSMTVHANYSRVREETMQALRAVERCPGCGDIQARLVEAGLIPALVAAMREVPMDVHTQSPACANLVLLTAANVTQRRMAVQHGAVPLALKAVENFPHMISSVDWAFDDQYTVYEDCLEALASMAKDTSAVVELHSSKAQGVVQAAMKNKPQPRVLMAGFAILTAT